MTDMPTRTRAEAQRDIAVAALDRIENESRGFAIEQLAFMRAHAKNALAKIAEIEATVPTGERRRATDAPGDGWQPIETAPKGELIMYFPEIGKGDSRTHHLPMLLIGYVSQFPHRKPTHWMPLPDSPK